MQSPTQHPELDSLLRQLVHEVRGVLGSNFVGVYLQGSLATGDFDEHSDVDFVIVTKDRLPSRIVDALQKRHVYVHGLKSRWAKKLEGSYFPQNLLRNIDRAGEELWYLDNGSSTLVRSPHCNTVVVRWILRNRGIVLAGPPISSLVGPVSTHALRVDILTTFINWGHQILAEPERIGSRFYQGFAVLSYCRMLRDFTFGTIASKRTCSDWAKSTLDPSWTGLIERAWRTRPNRKLTSRQPADSADLELTLQFVRYVMDLAIGESESLIKSGQDDAA